MMIVYDRVNYNCMHHAISRHNEMHGTDIRFEKGDEWQVRFIRVLRRMFTPLSTPVDGCLVTMSCHLGGFHAGIWRAELYAVEHNYGESVILSDMGTVHAEFKKVKFYGYNKKD